MNATQLFDIPADSGLFRAMVVNAAQLATYSQAKQAILATKYIEVKCKCGTTLAANVHFSS